MTTSDRIKQQKGQRHRFSGTAFRKYQPGGHLYLRNIRFADTDANALKRCYIVLPDTWREAIAQGDLVYFDARIALVRFEPSAGRYILRDPSGIVVLRGK